MANGEGNEPTNAPAADSRAAARGYTPGEPIIAMAVPPAARYRFGVFDVDPRSGELRKQGIRLRLRGRPFELLTLLLERAGEVVTREELRERLWAADTFVDFDHGVNTSVNKLREVLGDSAASPRFIETVPRRGYRFVAPVAATLVTPVPPVSDQATGPVASPSALPGAALAEAVVTPGSSAVEPARHGRRTVLAAAALALFSGLALTGWLLWRADTASRATPPTGRLMLAVLPFRNLDGGAPEDYFSDGVTEEMIAQLGALEPRRLGVIARTTVMQYKQSPRSISEIGRELDVDYVLEGSVRRGEGRVRVTAQLVQVSDQTQVWAESYESSLDHMLQAQQAAATRIASSLAVRILPGAAGGTARPMPASFAALEAYLRGRYFREQATVASVRRGIEYFQRATQIDPNYALAWAGLGDGYRLLAAPGWEDEPPRVLMTKAKAAIERALTIAPDLAEALAAKALLRFNMDWDLPMAERDIQKAIALNPSYAQAHQYYSSVLTAWGRFDEAIEAARRARELDPRSLTTNATLGVRYYYAGRYPEALAQFDATNEIDPNFGVTQWGMAMTRRELGDLEGAVRDMRRAADQSRGSYMQAWLGHTLAVAGRHQEARAVLESLTKESHVRYVSPFHFALVHLGLGEHEATLNWLERAYDDGSGWLPFLAAEPEFAPLRTHPRFVALLNRVRQSRADQRTP